MSTAHSPCGWKANKSMAFTYKKWWHATLFAHKTFSLLAFEPVKAKFFNHESKNYKLSLLTFQCVERLQLSNGKCVRSVNADRLSQLRCLMTRAPLPSFWSNVNSNLGIYIHTYYCTIAKVHMYKDMYDCHFCLSLVFRFRAYQLLALTVIGVVISAC